MNQQHVGAQYRSRRSAGNFFWADNVVVDEYLAKMGAQAFAVYALICRWAYLGPVRKTLREIGDATGASKDTASRAIKILVDLGLVEEIVGSGMVSSTYMVLAIAPTTVDEAGSDAIRGRREEVGTPSDPKRATAVSQKPLTASHGRDTYKENKKNKYTPPTPLSRGAYRKGPRQSLMSAKAGIGMYRPSSPPVDRGETLAVDGPGTDQPGYLHEDPSAARAAAWKGMNKADGEFAWNGVLGSLRNHIRRGSPSAIRAKPLCSMGPDDFDRCFAGVRYASLEVNLGNRSMSLKVLSESADFSFGVERYGPQLQKAIREYFFPPFDGAVEVRALQEDAIGRAVAHEGR